MKKSVEILGLSIISITEGIEIGTAQALVIDGAQHAVVAVAFDDGKWYKEAKLLPFADILGIGESAITIESASKTLALEAAPDLEKLLDADVSVVGTRVLTKGGQWKGIVAEMTIDDAGHIVSLDVENDMDGGIETVDTDCVYSFTREVTVLNDEVKVVAAAPEQKVAPVVEAPKAAPAPAKGEEPAVVVEEPAAAPTPEPVIEKASAPEAAAADAAQKVEEKSKRFMIGKKASRKIQTENGLLIVDQGGEITEEVIQKAKLANKFVELTMSVQ